MRVIRAAWLFLFFLSACASAPLPGTLPLDHPPRLGIIGFKVTAPIHHLSAIAQKPKELDPDQEPDRIERALRRIEDQAGTFLAADLEKEGTVVPVVVPDGLFGTVKGEPPSPEQIDRLRNELGLDAVLYGTIPWYGTTRPIYPILGESADIAAESVILGLVTHWNVWVISANAGFELLTSTPLWFGGAYVLGWAFRPVTIEARVVSSSDGKEIWHESTDRVLSRKILKTYPESERSKKEIQLEASLRGALLKLAKNLSR